MNVAEFVAMVIAGVGERCPVEECAEWQHHLCGDYLGAQEGRCEWHCVCDEEAKDGDDPG